ncbi:MAG: NAD(P)/FAD-dependent oxidoreductase [Silvibacterium sp.]|nr:NAD(P)/FAD-dependent oxidoreductase [Silvibacterium sp.]
MTATPETEQFDVVIVGAGLSGIGTGCHLRINLPEKTFVILEGRERLGGTWDLFRYPGVRSDSDMYTLGYRFRPWRAAKAIADGPSILRYITETAQDYGVYEKIRYLHRAVRASWSSEESVWTIEAEVGEQKEISRIRAKFLYLCTGYYEYTQGYKPEWPGLERFAGTLVHPQQWPEDLDYSGKRVVVIGSGATAVTLVPAMAHSAEHVTMLQRSPSYLLSLPSEDLIATRMRRWLPMKSAYSLARWKNVLVTMFFFNLSRKRPEIMKRLIAKGVRQHLGDGYSEHFTPKYNPWDQRMCFVPDSDFFLAVRSGKASVVTDQIEAFIDSGLRLRSGRVLDADIVVTATGLVMRIFSGLELKVDGEPVDLREKMLYKGIMLSDVPNMAAAIGYTNASWTLKCDLTADYVCRLLKYMDRRGYDYCLPLRNGSDTGEEPIVDFSSGYVQRALPHLPRQGSRRPWRLRQNYIRDLITLRYGRILDGTMHFGRKTGRCATLAKA